MSEYDSNIWSLNYLNLIVTFLLFQCWGSLQLSSTQRLVALNSHFCSDSWHDWTALDLGLIGVCCNNVSQVYSCRVSNRSFTYLIAELDCFVTLIFTCGCLDSWTWPGHARSLYHFVRTLSPSASDLAVRSSGSWRSSPEQVFDGIQHPWQLLRPGLLLLMTACCCWLGTISSCFWRDLSSSCGCLLLLRLAFATSSSNAFPSQTGSRFLRLALTICHRG